MNLQQLRYLVEIADCHSITRASQKLFVSQPYLSKVVSDFEERTKQKIFVRHSSGVELTVHGQKVYLLARSIIRQVEQLERLEQEDGTEERSVKLAFSVGNLLLKDSLLLEYLSATHASQMEIALHETTIAECVRHVEEETSEFAVVVADDVQKTLLAGRAAHRELRCVELDRGDPYYHLHRNHPLAQQDEIDADSLADYPFVQFNADEYAAISGRKLTQRHPGLRACRCISVSHYHSCLNIVRNTQAFAVGNKWQISELEKMGIQSVRASLGHQLHLMLIKKELRPLSAQAERMMRLFQDGYGLDGI